MCGDLELDRMDMILEENDALDWVYRGEGNANLVLAYAGSSPVFVGKVMRIQKARKSEKAEKSTNGTVVLTSDEQLLWRDYNELVSSPSKEVLEQRFVKHVMSPLLAPKHVDAGFRVSVSKGFFESVDKKVIKQRPIWRANATNVDMSHDSVLIMSDHALFSHGVANGVDCISVEIKPKCGFLPTSEFMTEDNALKSSISRFQMHQILKMNNNEIKELSEYDPLDLFSGSKERIHKAMKSLYTIPHNNFRVFLNGSLIFGGSGESIGRTTPEYGDTLEDSLKGFIKADDGLRTKCFIQLISEAVHSSRVLERLLEVQKLDNLDIEGAIHSYYDIISQPCPVCKELVEDRESLRRYSSLHSLPLEESLKIVRDFMIATTAKDCSVMMSFKPREDEDSTPSFYSLYLQPTNQIFDYKVHFIDLSLKALKKMKSYYELDKKIVGCYKAEKGDNKGESSMARVETD